MTVLGVLGLAANVWLMWRYRQDQAGAEDPVTLKKGAEPFSAPSP